MVDNIQLDMLENMYNEICFRYNETNYISYDIENELNQRILLELIECCSLNKAINKNNINSYIGVLKGIKEDFFELKIIDCLEYFIEYLENY